MVVIAPANPNAIEVSMVQTGCCTAEFDTTYPVHLNGIIRLDEFQQSIHRINQTIASKKPLLICGAIVTVCILGGMITFIAGGATAANSRGSGFPVLVGVGMGWFILGSLGMSLGCFCIQTRRMNRMRQAVAQESMKYSSRSPTPCSWRLDATRIWNGGYRYNQRARLIYRLVIEIGHAVAPATINVPYQFHPTAPPPVSYYPQPDNMPPPPYYEQATTGFCSQCGKRRENMMAKFCSSCGQPFSI